MNIQVKIKNVFGVDKIYPVCEKAKLFAVLLKQNTLTEKDIFTIKCLGFVVEVVSDQPKEL